MPGWISSGGSGPITWMLSNASWTAWKNQRQRKRRQGKEDAVQTANKTKENRSENQSNQRIRGRPGEGFALLYGGARLHKEDGLFAGAISLADRGLTRGAG